MGNKQQSSSPVVIQQSPSSKPSPFQEIPKLIGPYPDGWYYHQDDAQKADKDIQYHIHFKFKYNAFDYDHAFQQQMANNDNNDNQLNNNYDSSKPCNPTDEKTDDDDDDDDDNYQQNKSLLDKKYHKCRYEWVYTAPDNLPPHKIKENSYYNKHEQKMTPLPEQYEKIRAYLAKKDPIPPFFIRATKMAGLVFQAASKISLCKVKKLKCCIATKFIGQHKTGKEMHHPALLIWKREDIFCEFDDQPVTMVHLIKLPIGYKDDEEKKAEIDRIEIQCRTINKTQLDAGKWNYQYKEQLLDLENGLLDIAHWCLKYEIDNNYKYEKYMTNCRQFMIALCDAFKINFDEYRWDDAVFEVAKKVKTALSGGNNSRRIC